MSFELADKIKTLNVPNNNIFVSFDGNTLFTNVPVNSTIDHLLSIVDENALLFSEQTLKELLLLACSNAQIWICMS